MLIIGDVHGKLEQYYEIIKSNPKTLCVGDFGFREEWEWAKSNCGLDHLIIQGNHDDTSYRKSWPSVGDFTYLVEGIFTVAGAESVDKNHRILGVDYFDDEELSTLQQMKCLDYYSFRKPSIVVSHDCPGFIAKELWGYKATSTRKLLDALFQEHQPDLWIFGHHHKSLHITKSRTKFVCLNELETYKL